MLVNCALSFLTSASALMAVLSEGVILCHAGCCTSGDIVIVWLDVVMSLALHK